MKKSYLIKLKGELQERFELENSKGIVDYTTMVRMALSDFFDKLDKINSQAGCLKNNNNENGNL
jgi:hypothetical protein